MRPSLAMLTMLCTATAVSANPTVVENRNAGTSEWQLTSVQLDFGDGEGLRSSRIEGYATTTSVYPGRSIGFQISADPATSCDLDIYRLGYYGGTGGRHMRRVEAIAAACQSTPDRGRQRIREANWSESFKLAIPDDWPSGVYLAKMTRSDSRHQSYIVFIVKSRVPTDLLVQCSDITWQAYNKWPGRDSLYDHDSKQNPFNEYTYLGSDTRVSFDRPYALYGQHQIPEHIGAGSFLSSEFPLVYWLEQQGYHVAYCSGLDTDGDPGVLNRCKIFLSVGHDEYWTGRAVANVAAARDGGVSLAFLCGNALSRAVEFQRNAVTGAAARNFVRGAGLRREGRALMGSSTYGASFGDWVVTDAQHWIFEGTGMANGDAIRALVGWEYHGPPFADIQGLQVIASSPVNAYWSRREGRFAAIVYPGPRSNWVFNAGTIWWSQALSEPPGHARGGSTESRTLGVDTRVQKITENFLRRCLADATTR